MRYLISEDTHLVGVFDPDKTVSIQILNLDTNTLFDLVTNQCVESAIPGVYIYSTSNIINKPDSYTNCFYKMEDDAGNYFVGKFVFGGYPDQAFELTSNINDIVDIILQTETGNWEIKDNQWIHYDLDGNELFRFNLFDKTGKPAETQVYKRVRVS